MVKVGFVYVLVYTFDLIYFHTDDPNRWSPFQNMFTTKPTIDPSQQKKQSDTRKS